MAKDLFSKQAAIYARYRPVYPRALYDHLAALTPHHSPTRNYPPLLFV